MGFLFPHTFQTQGQSSQPFKTPMGMDKNSKTIKYCSLWPKDEEMAVRTLQDKNQSTPLAHTPQKNCGPVQPYHAETKWEVQIFFSCKALARHPNTSARVVSVTAKQRGGSCMPREVTVVRAVSHFHTHQEVAKGSSLTPCGVVSELAHEESELSSPPSSKEVSSLQCLGGHARSNKETFLEPKIPSTSSSNEDPPHIHISVSVGAK